MKKLKIAVIGTGHLGNFHIKLLKEIENCELTGIYDKDIIRAKEIGTANQVRVFETIDELLDAASAVSIVTSTTAHYETGKICLESGKNVFIEKPITSEIIQAEELVKIAKEKNVKLQVGHIERFNPALLSLDKYNLDPKFIQSDRLAQFNPRGIDVAVVHDLMIHDIDIILSLINSPVKNIQASGVAVVSDNIDIANARLEFENGAVANVTASRISQKKMRKMRMFQRDAYITLDFTSGTSEIYRLIKPEEYDPVKSISYGIMGVGENKKAVVYEQPEQKEINALKYELELFINSVLENKEPVVSGEDGLKALIVAEMIIKKIRESNPL
jgi:predicted dehydrogenase